ncbi:GAF and ANTAR domain-containing protein [Actinocatenispora rupis]|uniref:Transcriptional regulator n=1 Tax=Actinocatenispora rupis TaxID=519421 RepID=A0A8J3NCB1_9ACTN|nr:GAF and ANTAR domain-containing protein [Actinocatenispora rupis]GID10244.1 transcriptional regulator [Actinocatenispora rupis]
MTRLRDNADETALDRAHRTFRAFVALADTLVADFDIATFLTMLTAHATDLLNVDGAAVILRDQRGELQVAAASDRHTRLLEQFAVQTGDGPCIDCITTAEPVICTNLDAERARWPRFAAAANECGFHAAHALPMRLRDHIVGVLTLLNVEPDKADTDAAQLGQALADVATIGILQHRTIDHGVLVSDQLQTALTSRIVIEQAKGVLAERGAMSMDDAFAALRGYARAHHHSLTALARDVVDGTADISAE